MSCIATVIEKGTVWMGADSASTCGDFKEECLDPKIFTRHIFGCEWVMGIVGAGRYQQILHYDTEFPNMSMPKKKDLCSFIVKEFVPAVRRAFSEKFSYRSKDSGDEFDGRIVVGVQEKIFEIDSSLFVQEIARDFSTIGSGSKVAWGALYATPHLKPKKRILLALEASAAIVTTVGPPFIIIMAK